MISCSDDDSGSASGPKPTTVTVNGISRTFAYDEKGRIVSLIKDGDLATFQYNSKNQVQTVSDANETITFTYDSDGKYTGFSTSNGQSIVLTHLGNDAYVSNGESYAFYANGDWKIYLGTLHYNSKKGAFANVKHLNALALAVVDPESVYFASRKRHESIDSQGQIFNYTSTEGEKGLPATASVANYNFTYQYSE